MSTTQPFQPIPATPPKKPRRIFLWVFAVIQVLFLIWVISGVASGSGSSSDCADLHGQALKTCNDAADIGTGIGVFLIIVFWFFVDAFLGVIYGVYRLARRP